MNEKYLYYTLDDDCEEQFYSLNILLAKLHNTNKKEEESVVKLLSFKHNNEDFYSELFYKKISTII